MRVILRLARGEIGDLLETPITEFLRNKGYKGVLACPGGGGCLPSGP